MADDDEKPGEGAMPRRPVDLAGRKGLDTERLTAVTTPLAKQLAELERLSQPGRELQERMRRLTDAVNSNSAIGKLAERIAEQQKAIEGTKIPDLGRMAMLPMPEPVPLPDIEIPPHPAHETNERLERIEAHFEQMQEIATEAAAIANGLQGAAAEFLVKFERAARDNDRVAGWAIRIGAAAMLVAVLMPLVQIIYTEFWRVPVETAAMQAALTEMKTEIAGLRGEQANVTARLAAALENADRDSTGVLRDIRDILATMQGGADRDEVQPSDR